MALRVIQWSTGNVGGFALRAILGHPELELAGLWVSGPAKAGKDAGELCGLPPTGAVPQSVPASFPAFAALDTHTPASASSGCPMMQRRAKCPTFPVLHWITR